MNFKEFKEHVFDKYPKLESFSWTQYTPYFDFTKSPKFKANIDMVEIVSNDSKDALSDISKFLKQFSDDFYLKQFGDHASIRITKNGIEISDFDHE
jgi:hypothetical protein